jgi:hypothetical protein
MAADQEKAPWWQPWRHADGSVATGEPDLADLGTAFGLDASLADPAEGADPAVRRFGLQPGWQAAA